MDTRDPTVESNRLAQSKESREKGKEKGKKLRTVRLRRTVANVCLYLCIYHQILTMFSGVFRCWPVKSRYWVLGTGYTRFIIVLAQGGFPATGKVSSNPYPSFLVGFSG